MAVNKVVMNTESGEKTLIDLTADTVTPDSLADGATAHDASGNIITGKMQSASVLYTPQTLSDEQKAQARLNIGALAESDIAAIKKAIVDDVLYDDYEYIQSDRTAYIKLDFIPTSKTRIEAKVYFESTTTGSYIFGAQYSGTAGRFAFGNSSAKKYTFSWGSQQVTLDIAPIQEEYVLDINRNSISINGQPLGSVNQVEWEGRYPIMIFGLNSGGTITTRPPLTSKVCWMKIYEDDVFVHDLVARKHLVDGFGLYDKITEKFYGNAATSGKLTGG